MKNQSLKNLVKKSNLLSIKDDFIILSDKNNGNLRGGDNVGCPKKPGDDSPGVCDIVINLSCPVTNNSCTPKTLTLA